MVPSARRCILAVFAHPDDETSSCGGTFTKYAREGVEIHVVTATRGELGELGTGGLVIERGELPAVREAELRAVMELYGAQPPTILGYRDQELISVDFETLVQDVLRAMIVAAPDVVGEMALVDGQSRSATVSAHTAVRGLIIPQAPLWEFIDNDPHTGCILMRELARQLAQKLMGMNAMLGNIVSQQRPSTVTS